MTCTYGGGASNFLSTTMLDYFLASGPYYLSVNTADPGVTSATASANEALTGTRQQVTWTVAAARRIYNSSEILLTPDWDVTHWSLWDAATDGNLVASGELDGTKTKDVAFHLRPYDFGISLDPYDTRLGEPHPYDYVPAGTVEQPPPTVATWVSGNTGDAQGDGDGVVSAPAGLQEGDLIIAIANQKGGTGTFTFTGTGSTGWVAVGNAYGSEYIGKKSHIAVLAKIATGSEPATYNWDHTGSAGSGCVALTRFTDAALPTESDFSTGNPPGNVASATTGAVTQVENGLVVAVSAGSGGLQWHDGWDAPFVNMFESGNSQTVVDCAYYDGAVASVTATYQKNTNIYPVHGIFVIPPAS